VSKIKMVCAKCGYTCEWYASWWHEIMERKLDDENYICHNCYNEIADEAFEKWKKEVYEKKKKEREIIPF
jgi:uncharacterized CHY-type Zn-finger protein